jgi:hypothetical protein
VSKNPLESKIETYLKNQIKTVGGLCYKFKSTVNGVPDQLVIYNGTMYLVEVKRPGEKPRANQVHVHGQIKKQGVPVYTVDTETGVDTFIKDVLKAEPKPPSKPKTTTIQSKDRFHPMG